MAQIIEQSDKFGRIGKAFGQGLSEQIPKEVDRYRLSQGLKNFEKDSEGLNPMQQLTRLSSIPGITPQMIQSFGDLAKQQSTRNAYGNPGQPGQVARGSLSTSGSQGNMTNDQLENIVQRQVPRGAAQDVAPPADMTNKTIVDKNPVRPEAIPRERWTPQQVNQERAAIAQQFPMFTHEQVNQEVADRENRYLAAPATQREIDTYRDQQKTKVREGLTAGIERKLQKTGPELNKDISGNMLAALERGMENDLVENLNLTPDQAIDKWSEKALKLAEAKDKVNTLSGKAGIDNFFKKEETMNSLEAAQSVFANANNKKEFFDIVKTDFKISPLKAAALAYPRSKPVSDYISKIKKIQQFSSDNIDRTSRKYAADLGKIIDSDDSILAVVHEIQKKDPYFNKNAFINQLNKNKNQLSLSDDQKNELIEGTSDFFPQWGDYFILPVGY